MRRLRKLLTGGGCALCFGLLVLLVAGADAQEASSSFYVANWNVENLFDTVADPKNRNDDEFLPSNPDVRWTTQRLKTKLAHLSKVLCEMNNGRGPDVLGLEEVENPEIVLRLAEAMEPGRYGMAYGESPDFRGIDVALLFDRNRFTLENSKHVRVRLRRAVTRDILHATLVDEAGRHLHVLVNHWPSRGGGIFFTQTQRAAAAQTLRTLLEQIRRDDPAAAVLAMGDFNDEPADASISRVLAARPVTLPIADMDLRQDAFYNISIPAERRGEGSYVHVSRGRAERKMYDQMMVTASLLRGDEWSWEEDSFGVISPKYMVEQSASNRGASIPTYENGRYLGGYSDHFPVGARFVLRSAPAKAKTKSGAKAKSKAALRDLPPASEPPEASPPASVRKATPPPPSVRPDLLPPPVAPAPPSIEDDALAPVFW